MQRRRRSGRNESQYHDNRVDRDIDNRGIHHVDERAAHHDVHHRPAGDYVDDNVATEPVKLGGD